MSLAGVPTAEEGGRVMGSLPRQSRRVKRWYAYKPLGAGGYAFHSDQPEGGFASVSEVMDWLAERGEIEYVADPTMEDGGFWRGWGDVWHARGKPDGAE